MSIQAYIERCDPWTGNGERDEAPPATKSGTIIERMLRIPSQKVLPWFPIAASQVWLHLN